MNENYILIPIKAKSVRCPNKNRKLLPYTISYLRKINRLNNTVVITDCIELENYAKSLGVKTHLEIRSDEQNELLSCYNFIESTNYVGEYFFLMPVTHPFRALNLCDLFENKKEKYPMIDFIVSLNIFTDRSNFLVNIQDCKYPYFLYSMKRRGQDCKQYPMIDGSLYLIKKTFLKEVVKKEDTNQYFWQGNFHCVINEAPFVDIDTIEDMKKFDFMIETIVKLWKK